VSKARLDVALGAGELLEVAIDSRGIASLVARLVELGPTLVVLEASGGLQTTLVAELGAARLPVVVVNPRQVRDFARATGQLAKTDALDARMLALFAERIQPEVRRLPDAQELELKALVARRRELVELRKPLIYLGLSTSPISIRVVYQHPARGPLLKRVGIKREHRRKHKRPPRGLKPCYRLFMAHRATSSP
jgi:transposase